MRPIGWALAATIACVVVANTGRTQAEVVNPADAAGKPGDESAQPAKERRRSWEMPPVHVEGEGLPRYREEERIGPYDQPRWTATRRFPGTRVYVVPPGKVEFEYWIRPTYRKGKDTETRTLWELEFGLPHRFQLDLYFRTDRKNDTDPWLRGEQIELRYALADWGKIPGNPTLYFEYVSLERRPDKIEPKLLLGGEIAPGWHWGMNLVAELERGGAREHEYQVTGGLSRTIFDSRLSVGAEAIATFANVAGARGDFEKTYLLGPSVQFRPLAAMTINVAPLAGLTAESPDARVYLNFGWEF